MIDVQSHQVQVAPDLFRLAEQCAETALRYENQPPETDLTIVFSDDDEIQALNRQFLGNDAPTDVLSFPADEVDPETGQNDLGDIIISIPRAQEQAAVGKHAVEAEIQLLIVHGILHLLGYDHADEEDKQEMWKVQSEILSALGSPLRFPPEIS